MDTAEYRRIAEAATQGEWKRDANRVLACDPRQTVVCEVPGHESNPDIRADAEHVATFDPPTVLGLLDELDRLRAVVERIEAVVPYVTATLPTYESRRCELPVRGARPTWGGRPVASGNSKTSATWHAKPSRKPPMPDIPQSDIDRIGEWSGLYDGGRAAVRCEACGGRGVTPSQTLGGVECPKCDHGIRVVNERRFWNAMTDFWDSRDRLLSPEQLASMPTAWRLSRFHGRFNTPWQSALEYAVLAYHEPWEPTGDDVLRLLDAIVDRGEEPEFRRGCGNDPSGRHVCDGRTLELNSGVAVPVSETSRETILHAALAIAREEAT